MSDESPPPASEPNGIAVTRNRDTLMGRVLIGCIVGIVGLSVISIFKPPNDWNTFTKAIDAMISFATGILIGWRANSR